MMEINLLWPRWARIVASFSVAHVQARGIACWKNVRRAALLMLDQLERKQRARFYRGEDSGRIACNKQWKGQSVLRRRRRLFSLCLLLLVFALASPAAAQDEEKETALFRALGFALYGVSAGDAISTELALSNDGRELNPLQRNRAIRVASHAASPVSINRTTANLYRDGRKKTALWIRVAMVGVYGYATAHNLRQWQR